MSKFTQSSAIVALSLIIIISYYLFVQQDLVSTTEIARYKCLESDAHPSLCISCIQRSQLSIAEESSIFIKDSVNKFKVMIVPKEGILLCEELLQFVQYQNPMKSADDIKFQSIQPIKQVIYLLQMQISQNAVSKFEVDNDIQMIALFQIKQSTNVQNTLYSFSSLESNDLTLYFGEIMSYCSMGFSFFFLLLFRYKVGEFKAGFIFSIFISVLVIFSTKFQLGFALKCVNSLIVGFFYSKALISRLLTFLVLAVSLIFSIYFQEKMTECLISVLIIYLIFGRNKNFKKLGTLTLFCFAAIIICEALKEHHHWLSLPLRKITEFVIYTISTLFLESISIELPQQNYDKVPTGSGSQTGVTLPGFEQDNEQSSQEQD